MLEITFNCVSVVFNCSPDTALNIVKLMIAKVMYTFFSHIFKKNFIFESFIQEHCFCMISIPRTLPGPPMSLNSLSISFYLYIDTYICSFINIHTYHMHRVHLVMCLCTVFRAARLALPLTKLVPGEN